MQDNTGNMPPEFVRRMTELLPGDHVLFFNKLQDEPTASVRINAWKPVDLPFDASVPWSSSGYYLKERPLYAMDPHWHAGCYYVQEASSIFLEQAVLQCTPEEPLLVLDLCAAPGGKSTHLASILPEQSLLVANETIRSRVSPLYENLVKWGSPDLMMTNNDPSSFKVLEGWFDVVVVDAPCSGEGLMRKDKSVVKSWTKEEVMLCAARQKRILQDAWMALKPGGVLIYSTCTWSVEENELNMQWMIKEFDAESIPISLKMDWGIEASNRQDVYGYRFYPHRLTGEGFFMSVIKKDDSGSGQTQHRGKRMFDKLSTSRKAPIEHWLSLQQQYEWIGSADKVGIIPKRWMESIHGFLNALTVTYFGQPVATYKGAKAVPEHALAMSRLLNKSAFSHIELDKLEALNYLRKDATDQLILIFIYLLGDSISPEFKSKNIKCFCRFYETQSDKPI